ncbi:DUF6515 family protein [Pseudomonas sp. DWP3-1-2]|uniref:DUF6515 family protein n=1 Tax=Pseudomonas sp. DWP3-1-2 TaxID=2804645 RepID=UPI003CEAAE32
MKSGIWRVAGVSLLCLVISAQTLAEDQGPGSRDQNDGGEQQRPPQRPQQQIQQQQNQQRQVERQQQQQIQQQQGQQRQVERQQQQQIQQQQVQQRQQEQQNQRLMNQQQQNQQRQIQEQQNQQRQVERQQLQQRQDNLPIQRGPDESRQTQQPRQGYYQDNGNNRNPQAGGYYRPNDRWEGRPDGHGNGWGPGPRYKPGYVIDRVPPGYSRVPYRGQDFFYSEGYWYRPDGPRYVVVTPPYGARVRSLPPYSQEVVVGSTLFFLAAGTYYLYQNDTQDYVVTMPPQPVQSGYAQPIGQGSPYDPVAYPANGQSPEQIEQDRYDCYRWSVDQSSFDPANPGYQPAPAMIQVYRRSMVACLMGRGYVIN